MLEMEFNMKVLYHDENIVVIIKDIHQDAEHDVPNALKKEGFKDIYTLHRLDKNVGGIMVYALNKKAAAHFSKLIQDGSFIKEYRAIIHGEIEEEEAILEDFLFKDSKTNKVFTVKKERKGVKYAKLEYRCIKKEASTSLVHIRLYTGRTHQIRVQFASRKHPLVGDHKYGSKDLIKEPLLYACKLTFPYKHKQMVFEDYPDWAN